MYIPLLWIKGVIIAFTRQIGTASNVRVTKQPHLSTQLSTNSMDPISVAVPQYEEDLEESFIGPAGIAQFYGEDEQAYYEGEDHEEPITEPLELSAAQSGNPEEVPHVDTVSGYTHAKGPEQPRGAVLFNRSHYDALTLSPAAWALVDGTS